MALTPLIRPAHVGDLRRIWDIRFANDIAGQPLIPEQGPVPPYLTHLLAEGRLLVATVDDHAVGYAGLVERGEVAYLTDLFVDPERQSATIGQRLLHEIMPEKAAIHCTMATTDHRALALYTRAGMPPRWPNLLLEASVDRLRELPSPRVEMVPADPDDPALTRWDYELSGRARPMDLAFLVRAERGEGFWFISEGETIGYGIIRFGAARLWHPDAVTIGPVGAATAYDAHNCVLAAVNWARTRAPVIELAVPGPHPALRPLLDGGCIIVYVETYCASTADLVDPQRYIGSGGDLF